MRPAIIGAPTSLGAFAPGQEQAPRALREAGVASGFDDFGDIPLRRWGPDRERRRAQNADGVVQAAREVAERVEAAFRAGRTPVVLGGDCTVGVGTVACALAAGERFGLVYFDLHPDLNTPETATTGTLDWMGVAHMLGLPGTVPELAAVARLAPDQVLFFARQDDQTRPGEREAIERLGIESIMVEEVAADPPAAAARAAQRFDRYLVHFDVDVVDFVDLPLSENTGHNIGLPFDAASAALETLVADPRFAGLTVTEHNPAHGAEDGSTTAALAAALQRALS
jgi:arginase